MEFKAQQIAAFIQGRVIGDENAVVHTFAKIEEGKPGAISFLASPKYTHYLYETQSSVVLVDESIEVEKPVQATMIVVKNARDCVAKLLQLYESMKPKRVGVTRRMSRPRPRWARKSISEPSPISATELSWAMGARSTPT